MNRRIAAAFGWLLAVGVATTVGLLAVSWLTGDLTSQSMTPLSKEAVARALASSTSAPAPADSIPEDAIQRKAAPEESPDPPSRPGVETRSLSSPGGTVIAQCTGTVAFLVSWSPGQGYGVEEQVRGPAASTLIQFDGEDQAVTVTVACPGGEPVAAVVVTDD